MKYDLQGTTMQLLNMELDEGERFYSESGRLVYMSDNVKMDTEAKGGIWKSIKRTFSGESFFLVHFTPLKGKGILGFSSEFPGKIIPMKLKQGEEIIAQKDAYLGSDSSIEFDATFTKRLGAGFLGGEGFILLKIKGPGEVFFNVSGEISEIYLEKGQKLRIDTSNLAMFDASVDYNVERIKGIKNMLFGGEGIFLATCTGPGRVWVQSMPIDELARKLYTYMPKQRGSRSGGAVAGGLLLGSMMGGRR